jgi:hypothetical protein
VVAPPLGEKCLGSIGLESTNRSTANRSILPSHYITVPAASEREIIALNAGIFQQLMYVYGISSQVGENQVWFSTPPILLRFAFHRWCCRILALDPVPRAAGET